jgi:hypothetical protein
VSWRDPLVDDAPLTEEERRALALEDDDGCADAGLARALGALADDRADPRLSARIMLAVEERRPSLATRLRNLWARPRTLRYTLMAAAPAVVAAAALLVPLRAGGDPAPGIVTAADTGIDDVVEAIAPEPKPSPATQHGGAVPVQFRLAAPGAERVHVAGDFNDWDVGSLSLRDDGDGVWTATVPLPPGRYGYMFVVDGEHWVVDPAADAVEPDGFGGQNALLRI